MSHYGFISKKTGESATIYGVQHRFLHPVIRWMYKKHRYENKSVQDDTGRFKRMAQFPKEIVIPCSSQFLYGKPFLMPWPFQAEELARYAAKLRGPEGPPSQAQLTMTSLQASFLKVMAMSQPRWWTISVTSFLWVDSKAIKTQNL